jgi:putative transcriptional regulator
MVRITLVKRLRIELGLSQVEFAERFHIPVGTLRDWEQRRYEPDQAGKPISRRSRQMPPSWRGRSLRCEIGRGRPNLVPGITSR